MIALEYGSMKLGALDFGSDLSARASRFLIWTKITVNLDDSRQESFICTKLCVSEGSTENSWSQQKECTNPGKEVNYCEVQSVTCSFRFSISVVRRELALKMWCWRWGCFELSELCQVFRRMRAAPSHKLQLAEHRKMQDDAVPESRISFGAAGVTSQSSWSVAQEIFFCWPHH